MALIHHYPFCPHSRFIRIILGEMGMEPQFVEERPWERRMEFLAINPAGTTPVLIEDGGFVVSGAGVIAEYLDETRGLGMGDRRLLPESPAERAEIRRLMDWFLNKFHEEVSSYLVHEKIYKRFIPMSMGGGAPDMAMIRAARANIRYHLQYIGYLTSKRNWLAGDKLSYADMAAAAHLSTADYLGDVPWDEQPTAKEWYARIKSRRAFRSILNDRIPGMAPVSHYTNLDF
ncbi:glutathione S-transferase family protein [Microvirga sp. W0021]|uniref:Glutathione S-transferase family protein n=1 Tax=Hohaiivirga grylli TaxID=3133970 RepID=A0ABV0BJ05_9HYPH